MAHETHTILAVGTPPGRSAVGMVRLSGPDTAALLCDVVSLPARRGVQAARLQLGELNLPCLVLWMPGPGSYTGEDVAECMLPGNPLLLERVVQQLLQHGRALGLHVEHATGGEFTFRAWRSGGLPLAQAEAVMQLVTASNAAALQAAHRAASGGVHVAMEVLAADIAQTLALVEAGIDFTDEEDVVIAPAGDMAARLLQLQAAIDAAGGGAKGAEHDDDRPVVLLRGCPSAGKSTLFNALLGTGRAVTQAIPHTTRDDLVEPLQLPSGRRIRLVDTPGIDDSMPRCDGIAHDLEVWCVPVGEVPPCAKGVCVYTKADLGNPPAGVLAVSAVTGVGLDALCDAIDEALLSIEGAAGASVMSARQRALLMRVRTQLTSVLELVRSQSPTAALMQPELVAGQLRECLDLVGEITGHIDADDVLGLVFSSFCIGK